MIEPKKLPPSLRELPRADHRGIIHAEFGDALAEFIPGLCMIQLDGTFTAPELRRIALAIDDGDAIVGPDGWSGDEN